MLTSKETPQAGKGSRTPAPSAFGSAFPRPEGPAKRSLVEAVTTMSENGHIARIDRDAVKALLLQCESVADFSLLAHAFKNSPAAMKAAADLVSDSSSGVQVHAANVFRHATAGGHDISAAIPALLEAGMSDNRVVLAAVEQALAAYSPVYYFVPRPATVFQGAEITLDYAHELAEAAHGQGEVARAASDALRAIGFFTIPHESE